MKVKSMAETSELRKQYEEFLDSLDKQDKKKFFKAMRHLMLSNKKWADEWRAEMEFQKEKVLLDKNIHDDGGVECFGLKFLKEDEMFDDITEHVLDDVPVPALDVDKQETIDEYFMRLALKEAVQAYREDEVPVGAVLVSPKGEVLATAHNTAEHGLHAMAHAETVAMSVGAISLQQKRLWDCTLYVTLEPCAMCAAAMTHMRIKRLVYGASNPKGGAVENGVRFFDNPSCNHRPLLTTGVLSEECGDILTAFFRSKR